MNDFPLFLLDSGDPDEFREIDALAKEKGQKLWGSTTNPSLIAKKLQGRKVSMNEAFKLQKELVLEIVSIVPGAVSAEVYADEKTTAEEMINQGRQIATWHERIVIKLPTTIEGFKARAELRKEKIPINNTLVFTQQQIFAICLHERIMQETYGPIDPPKIEHLGGWPPFISPFVGRLDDQGEDGLSVVEHGMEVKKTYSFLPWMLEASVRRLEHIKRGFEQNVELITSPAKVWREWFALSNEEIEHLDSLSYAKTLKPFEFWNPEEFLTIPSTEVFMENIESNTLDIRHPLTDKGIERFADDWKAIIA